MWRCQHLHALRRAGQERINVPGYFAEIFVKRNELGCVTELSWRAVSWGEHGTATRPLWKHFKSGISVTGVTAYLHRQAARRASQRGERRHPELSVRALHPAGIPGAVSLAAPLGHVLGRSQCSAPGAVGLLPAGPLRPSRDDQGRPAVLRRPAICTQSEHARHDVGRG